MNNVSLIGRIGSLTELRHAGDTPVLDLRLAVDRRRAKDGTEREPAWFDITAFGKTAELVHQYCGPGRQIAVTGRLEQDTWQAEDGGNRSRTKVVAESVDFLAKPADGKPAAAAPPAAAGKPKARHADDDVPF